MKSENTELQKKVTNQEIRIKELEQQLQLKNKYISLIAHNFSGVSKNFLWVIDALEEGSISYNIFESLLPELKNNVLNNHKAIESSINWINSQHQGFKIQPVEIKLFELFCAISDSLNNDLENKSINLSFQGNQSITFTADEVLITFILKSIIENAIKYSYPGSVIDFNAQLAQNKYISVIIKDSGIGMNKQLIENIFTLNASPYTGTSQEIGSGLSLVFAKDFVELMGGTIKVHSEEERGTEIELQLPLVCC